MKPIIPSIIWDDLYKMTMCQSVFFQFPRVKARYKFYDREPYRPYPPHFAEKLQEQVNALADLSLTDEEEAFLNRIRFLKPNFVEWFKGYRYNPKEVEITQDLSGRLHIYIEGLMYRTMWWEVKLMLLISALSLKETPIATDAEIRDRMKRKADYMSLHKLHWIDFGTRRARSPEMQDRLVQAHLPFKPYFRGTSNMALAMFYDITPIGTVAHEWFMLHQGLYGFSQMNYMALENWVKEYDGDLGIVLPDTMTTEVFLRSFTRKQAELWKGYRLDSGDCLKSSLMIAEKIKKDYQIEPTSKIWTPSDGLTDVTAVKYQTGLRNAIGSDAMVTAGMGTFLSNDVAPEMETERGRMNDPAAAPRKIVIKLDAVDVGNGWVDVIKLSDEPGKFSGNPKRKAMACEELGITC